MKIGIHGINLNDKKKKILSNLIKVINKNKIDILLKNLKKTFYFIFFISITSYSQESIDEQKLLLIEALKEFSETISVTGREDNASEYLKSYLKNSN